MKVILDTNVLIGFFRDPTSRARFEIEQGRPLIFMSSVVAMELLAGCRTNRQQKAFLAFLKPFDKAGRVVTPSLEAYLEAGRVLARLGEENIGIRHRRQMISDILIAISATTAGMVVVTSNVADFSRIQKCTPVRWKLPDQDSGYRIM